MVGVHFAQGWLDSDTLTMYSRDGVPYGLVGKHVSAGETFIASTMHEADVIFPHAMLKDMLKMIHTIPVTFITDVKQFHDKVQRGLEPHGFKFAIIGDIMYSRNNYKGRNYEKVA